MRTVTRWGLALTAGAVLATAGGAVAATAATGRPTPAVLRHHHRRAALLRGVVGVVVTDSATGGERNHGVLVIKEADGTELTFSFSKRPRAWKIMGAGVPRTAESPTALAEGELVALRFGPKQPVHVARVVLDLGFLATAG